jgi:DoxX-like family
MAFFLGVRPMNHPRRIYWLATGLAAIFMLMASVPDVLQMPAAIEIFTHLGYPIYLLPFLGTAKVLGVIAVLVPSASRLKEWAYAGLVFDLMGALYSHVSVGDSVPTWAWPITGLVLVSASYLLYRTKGNDEGNTLSWHVMAGLGTPRAAHK